MKVRHLLTASAVAIGTAVAYQRWGNWADSRRFSPSGRLVLLGTRRIHWDQRGSGEPLVVLEAGLSATSLSWALVQEQVAQFISVASYDRAGLGWSDPSDEKPSVLAILSDLHQLILAAAKGRQVILVGHSFGGLLVRAYARLFPERVAGLVLLDPVSIEQWAEGRPEDLERLGRGARLARRGALLAELGVVRLCLTILAAGHSRIPRLVAKSASHGPGLALVDRLTRQMSRLPTSMWPLVRAHWSRASSFRVLARYLDALPANARGLVGVQLSKAIPLTILSAESATPAELHERDRWAATSHRGRHIRVPDSGHWLQLDNPEIVAGAVEGMAHLVRCS